MIHSIRDMGRRPANSWAGYVSAAAMLALLFLSGASAAATTVPLEIEHGILFVRGELNGVCDLLFVLDPGARDFLTPYGISQLRGRPAKETRCSRPAKSTSGHGVQVACRA